MKMIAAGALLAPVAHATQPLEEFIARAHRQSFDSREQTAVSRQRDWESDAALGRLLPVLSARGAYTRNQYEVAVTLPGTNQRAVVAPSNQLDASFRLDASIVDLSSYHRYQQAKLLAEAAELQTDQVNVNVDRSVARSYYSFLGTSALVTSAEGALALAQDNLDFVRVRREGGAVTDLDVARAEANVERSRQDLADAQLLRTLAARNLETLSGVRPTDVQAYPRDDLRDEGRIEQWLATQNAPSDKVQAKLSEAAAAAQRASRSAMAPSLAVSAEERLTNATGFAGYTSQYALQAVLSWKFDYNVYANAKAASAAADVQQIRAERTRRDLEDSIFDAYHRVEAGLVKSASARAQAESARVAADLAGERYRAGVVTQLDVTEAQREAFRAQASRIQADADLAYSRVALRVAAGLPLTFRPPDARVPESASDSAPVRTEEQRTTP